MPDTVPVAQKTTVLMQSKRALLRPDIVPVNAVKWHCGCLKNSTINA
jgi:hypothetical protein